jgi:hypothetical protein
MSESGFQLPAFVCAFCLVPGIAGAAETDSPPDKSAYNLFNPVPQHLMRELEPDRPDATENPHTVDAGHFQLEMDFANFTYNKSGGGTADSWNIAPFNFKMGLLNNVDLQLVYDNYIHIHARDHGFAASQSGFGDFTTRLKINLWGNDGGETAFALLPFVKFPTSTGHIGNGAVEGGIILPLSIELPAGFELGTEAAAGVFRNDHDNGHHAECIGSASLDHAIVGNLSGYVEFFASVSTESPSAWIGTADFGLEYLLTKDVQLDCGCNVGLTSAADTAHAFSGITIRF